MSDQNLHHHHHQQHRSPNAAAKFQIEQQQQQQRQPLPQPTNPFFSHIPKYQYSSSPPPPPVTATNRHYPLVDSLSNELDTSLYGGNSGQHPLYHPPNSPPTNPTNNYEQNYSTATTTTASSCIPINQKPTTHPLHHHYQQNLRQATPPSSPKHQFLYSNRNSVDAGAASSPPLAGLDRTGSLKKPNTYGRCYEKLPPCKPDNTEIVASGKGDLRGEDQGKFFRVCGVERRFPCMCSFSNPWKCLQKNNCLSVENIKQLSCSFFILPKVILFLFDFYFLE